MEQRLSSRENKLILLNYLLSEMQAARILAARNASLDNGFGNVSTSDAVFNLLFTSIFITSVI